MTKPELVQILKGAGIQASDEMLEEELLAKLPTAAINLRIMRDWERRTRISMILSRCVQEGRLSQAEYSDALARAMADEGYLGVVCARPPDPPEYSPYWTNRSRSL